MAYNASVTSAGILYDLAAPGVTVSPNPSLFYFGDLWVGASLAVAIICGGCLAVTAGKRRNKSSEHKLI